MEKQLHCSFRRVEKPQRLARKKTFPGCLVIQWWHKHFCMGRLRGNHFPCCVGVGFQGCLENFDGTIDLLFNPIGRRRPNI